MVKIDTRVSLYLRIMMVSLLVAFLGLGPVPHALSALLKNAKTAMDSGDWSNAKINLANAAHYYPWRAELNIDAAHAAFKAEDFKGTIEYLERPATFSRLSTDDLILLGEAYSQSGNASKAEAIWKGVINQANSIQASQDLIDLYMKQEDYASAASQMQNLLTLNPGEVRLYYQVGLLYAVTDPIKALPYLAQAIDIDPSNASKAQDLYDKIRTATLFNQPAYTLLASGRKLADMSEWALAAGAFKRATEIDPGYADAWAFMGEAEQQIVIKEAGSSSEVGLAELERALQLDPQSALANTFMGLYWERQQDFTQAKSYLDQAIAITPEDPYLYTEQGNILSKAGDLPAAQVAYEKAIQLAPKEALFYRLLAEFALENHIQIHELALQRARQAIMLNPNDPASLDLMAKVMIALQDYYSAKNYAEAAIHSDPGFEPAYLHLGTAYLYLNESDLARQWLDKASKLDPGSWSAAQAKRMIEYYFP